MTEPQSPPEAEQQTQPAPGEPLYGAEDIARALHTSGSRALAQSYYNATVAAKGSPGLTKDEADQMIDAINNGTSWPPQQAPSMVVISNIVATPDQADGTLCEITWDTDVPADTQVKYGADMSYGSETPLDPTQATSHSVSLTGLNPATTYHYSVASGGTFSPDATFVTGGA
jgi:hypothetical protein